MTFAEPFVRPLLVLHTICAAVLVGAATHQVVWMRGYLRRDFRRAPGERRFALIATTAFVCTFVLGTILYPTYKVRVRAEYFDAPAAVASEVELRRAATVTGLVPSQNDNALTLVAVARRFDIKEHWVALGCAASLALLFLSRRSHPKDNPAALPLYVGLALFVAFSAWLGAIVGILTAAHRAVGGI